MAKEAENPITTELVKANVTEAVIQKLRTEFLSLKINGIDDKEGYEKVHKARIQCRDVRVLTEKICKKGREDAVRIQKEWIAKEKEVVAQVSEVEGHLKKQEDAIDTEKEAIKIRQERLLKLPGRKEQTKGIEEFLGELTDEDIMRFDDAQWNEIIVISQGKKLAAQLKVIDDAKATAEMNLMADRENALYKIAGATMQIRHGMKTFYKGTVTITEDEVRTLENEQWNIRFGEIANAKGETPKPTEPNYSVHHFDKPVVSELQKEASDEEKLFNYASALEKVPVPDMKTEKGDETLNRASLYLTEAIQLLRK
jgi:hypothetical protein